MNPQLCEKACETFYDYLKKCVVCKHAGTMLKSTNWELEAEKEGLQQRKSGVEE